MNCYTNKIDDSRKSDVSHQYSQRGCNGNANEYLVYLTKKGFSKQEGNNKNIHYKLI